MYAARELALEKSKDLLRRGVGLGQSGDAGLDQDLRFGQVGRFRGEIRVILLNLGREEYTVHKGDRIAQMVIGRYEAIEWDEGELSDSVRGAGGFGSSGR